VYTHASDESLAFQLGTLVAGVAELAKRRQPGAAAQVLPQAVQHARQLGLAAPRVPEPGQDEHGSIRQALVSSKSERVADLFSLGVAIARWDVPMIEMLARRTRIPDEIWREPCDREGLPTAADRIVITSVIGLHLHKGRHAGRS
jgi:hypothetical protein